MAGIQELAFFFLIFLLSFVVILQKLLKKPSNEHHLLPPSPLALPIIGHLHLLSPIPHQSLAKLASNYGPLMHIRLGSVPCVVASSPEIAKELLKTHESSFSDRPQSAASDILTYGSQDFTFAPYGPRWKLMKKLCMSQLLGGQTLDSLKPIRRREIERLVESLTEHANHGRYVDIGRELINMVSNVISSMMLSQRCCGDEDEAVRVRSIIQESAEILGKFNLSDYVWFCKNMDLQGYGKRSKGVRDRFDEMMEKIIDEHQRERISKQRGGENTDDLSKDILHILLDASDEQGSHIKLSRENIKSFVLDLLVAGTDTSAITTEWALAELINHPSILQKAAQEIDSKLGRKRLIEESDISNLPYLQAIAKETLRLHPPGPLLHRKCSKDCTTVAGYNIKAKTYLFVNVWAINRDPNYWENPLEFRPERFLAGKGDGQLDVRGQNFHFLPFGSGRRGCPGTSLGMNVVQTTLGALIQCFQWKVESDGAVDMEEGAGLTLPRAHPLICMPIARISSCWGIKTEESQAAIIDES